MKSNHHKGQLSPTTNQCPPASSTTAWWTDILTPGGRDTPHAWLFCFPSIWMVLFLASGISYTNECSPLKEGPPVSRVLPWGSSLPLCLVNSLLGSSRSQLPQSAEPGRFCLPCIMAWESSQGSSLGYLKAHFLEFLAFWNSMVCCLKPSVFKRAVIFSLDFECLWQKGKRDLCSLLSRSRRLVNTVFKYTDSVQWLTKMIKLFGLTNNSASENVSFKKI